MFFFFVFGVCCVGYLLLFWLVLEFVVCGFVSGCGVLLFYFGGLGVAVFGGG